jgi:hypothetical protein
MAALAGNGDERRGADSSAAGDPRHPAVVLIGRNSGALDLEAGELVLGHREMWRAERAFRSMKSLLREPVYHRADRRIVSPAHLCVLACLLMRIAKNRMGEGWSLIQEKVERVSMGKIETDSAARFRVESGPRTRPFSSPHLSIELLSQGNPRADDVRMRAHPPGRQTRHADFYPVEPFACNILCIFHVNAQNSNRE